MGEEGVNRLSVHFENGISILKGFLFRGSLFLLSFSCVTLLYLTLSRIVEQQYLWDFFPAEWYEKQDASKRSFDKYCHKSDFNSLIGKKLSFYPTNSWVVEFGNRSKMLAPGTYIRLNKKKIVTEIFCISE